MAGLEELVEIEITKPLPLEGDVNLKYVMEGIATFQDISAPPWVYAKVQKKEWARPEIVEAVDYKRGFPMPLQGTFSITWTPKETGIYEVTVVATPAPFSLPVIEVFPITGQSDMMKITIKAVPIGLEILSCSFV